MDFLKRLFSRKKHAANSNGPHQNGAAPPIHGSTNTYASTADNPIQTSQQDSIGRAHPAENFAKRVLSLNTSEGLVVSVLGPWGSGKTSFVNLARAHFESDSVPVLEFNPWMFSGAEQLVQSFFSELSSELKLKPSLAEVGKRLEEYGDVFSNLTWLPVVGSWFDGGQKLTKHLGGVLQRKKEGTAEQRNKVNSALRELSRPIVVILDDIDRLNTAEIRDIFRLVRLTANFPNIIYVLAFDRKRVEDALSEQGIPGRAYLEKIIQVGFDLPSVPTHLLNQQILDCLNAELNGLPQLQTFDRNVWPDIFMEVIRPLITNMRDVRRYSAAVGGTVRSLGAQVALVDVLALEAVRVFLPDVFERMPGAVAALTTSSDGGDGDEDQLRAEVQALVEAAGLKATVITALINRLFMAAQPHVGGMQYTSSGSGRWLKERRVAHADILRFYLEQVASEGLLAFNQAETAWAKMGDIGAFSGYLQSVDPNQLEETISALEAFEAEVTPERVLPGVITLLNLLPTLPDKERGMFDFGKDITVIRVVLRLIKAHNSEACVDDVVQNALPKLETAFSKLILIQMVGHRSNVGHQLVAEDVAKQFERSWRDYVRALSVEGLASEYELLGSLLVLKRESEPDEPSMTIPADVRVTRAVLLSAQSESQRQAIGTRAVTKSTLLNWKVLIDLYGDEDTLSNRIEDLRQANFDDCAGLLALADRYLAGWRPRDFTDD